MASYGDSYNGTADETVSWAQTLTDLDIALVLPSTVIKGSQVRVFFSEDNVLHVATNASSSVSNDADFIELKLAYGIKRASLSWTLQPGKCVQIYLEKTEERWWDVLCCDGRGKIANFDSIDAHQSYAEMNEDEKAVVRKLVEQQKQRWKYGEAFQGDNTGSDVYDEVGAGGDALRHQ